MNKKTIMVALTASYQKIRNSLLSIKPEVPLCL